VVIDPELEPALTGIEGFSHLIVLYYQHRKDEWQERVGWGKRGERILGLPTGPDGSGFRGILTTRAPARPSGIGLAVVELIERRGNRLRVKGLDAIDGSPVLDVRGYMLEFDAFPQARTPRFDRPEGVAVPKPQEHGRQ
jgi:tRNA-Thr(GGU) m(6)t(6)A37 methyltransferase TsaA